MDDFWEFPTVSLGIGPVNAIYQAWYNRYLHERGIKDTSQQHVWSFMGDGEIDEAALEYALEKRAQLGGFLPERRTYIGGVALPAEKHFDAIRTGSGKQKVATTMALVRLIKDMVKDKDFGFRIVPIIPDEARTFGLDAMFPSAKIFNTLGQHYTAVDADMLLSYKESTKGQLLYTGISESGSTAAFAAVGTSYATHNVPMVPFYIFYSMFGFQRTGDQFWAAADQLAYIPHLTYKMLKNQQKAPFQQFKNGAKKSG